MKRIAGYIALASLVVACTPDEEKVRKVIERGLQECKDAEGDFAEITVVEGKDEVLRETCTMEITDLKLTDDYHATAQVGPYTWLIGIDSEHGVWTLTQIDWDTLAEARRAVAGGDPPPDARQRAEKAFAKAQEEMPSSAWIREQRFKNLLALREKERSKSDDAIALGDAGTMLEETQAWGNENDRPEVAAAMRLEVVDYYKDFAHKLEMSFDNLGSSDEHLEATIRQAEKDGDREAAADYRKVLEDQRAERPEIIATMQKRIVASRKAACEQLSKLDPNALEGELRDRVVAAKDSTDCSPEAFEAPEPGADEEVAD